MIVFSQHISFKKQTNNILSFIIILICNPRVNLYKNFDYFLTNEQRILGFKVINLLRFLIHFARLSVTSVIKMSTFHFKFHLLTVHKRQGKYLVLLLLHAPIDMSQNFVPFRETAYQMFSHLMHCTSCLYCHRDLYIWPNDFRNGI